MVPSQFIERLRSLNVGTVLENELLSRHTSFRIGGPASVFVEPSNLEGIIRTLELVRDEAIRYFIIGQGTNVLVSDQGLDAVVISTSKGLRTLAIDATRMEVGSGILLTKLAREAQRHALSGLEFAISIPGTLGGALFMNAGAHGSSMREVVESVLVWDAERGVHQITADEAQFEYRHSRFQRVPWIALTAVLQLRTGDSDAIKEAMAHHMAYRKKTQPVGDPNAGSVFKNPLPHYAGQLIERIGGKGWRMGDAEVSPVHANFIVNRGAARAIDVLMLMRRIRCIVYHETGILLRPEIRWIGPAEGGANTEWENLWYKVGDGLREPCE